MKMNFYYLDVITAVITTSANTNSSNLEDEAFDSTGEMSTTSAASNLQHSPSSIMRRSTSLASADVGPRDRLRQLSSQSKTPPTTRKSSSPEVGGRKSLQRKMQKIMLKRHGSGKLRAATDASTQTPQHQPISPLATPNQSPQVKSFLYPTIPHSPYRPRARVIVGNPSLQNGRLGSSGEEIENDSFPNQAMANNVSIRVPSPVQTDDFSNDFQNLAIHEARNSPVANKNGKTKVLKPLTIQNSVPEGQLEPNGNNVYHQMNYSIARRDSGLSGCSTFTMTSSERSIPVTPVLLSEYQNPPDKSSAPRKKTFSFSTTFQYEEANRIPNEEVKYSMCK